MTSTIDWAARMARRFEELTADLHATQDPDRTVHRLVELAVDLVPRCEWASALYVSGRRRPSTAAHSDLTALHADDLQRRGDAGPGLAAARDADGATDLIAVADMVGEERWPQFCAATVERTAVRSALSFRISQPDPDRGAALTMYGSTAGPFAPETLETAALFATHARSLFICIETMRKAMNLSEALVTSRLIGSAIGILMLSRKVTSEEAFGLLRDASQRLHIKLRDLADEVMRTGELPTVPARRLRVAPSELRADSVPA